MKFFRSSKLLALALVLVLSLSILAGCGTTEDGTEEPQTNNGNDNELTGTLDIAGSTSVQPVAELLAEEFMANNPGVKVNYNSVGSSGGIKAANNGTAHIGTASRDLKASEEEWGIDKHVLAYDGIAVVIHPSNGVEDLTKEQVQKIFLGEITNWSEVGGVDKDIIVVSREAGSGTRGAFEEIVELEKEIEKGGKKTTVSGLSENALIAKGNGEVRANVASKEDAIGYISFSYINDEVKTVKVDGTEPTVENVLANNYGMSRPFLMLTKGEINPLAKAFLDFALSSEGQGIVAEEGAIPVE